MLVKGAVPGPRGGDGGAAGLGEGAEPGAGGPMSTRPRPPAGRPPGAPPVRSAPSPRPARVDRRDVRRHRARHGRPRAAGLRHRAQHGRPAPGGHGPAGGGPRRHPVDQDPRRGPRRRGQALPPEGHRPRPAGLDPVAPVGRRRGRPRAQAPRATASGRPRRWCAWPCCSALSDRAAEDRVALVDAWAWEAPRTKDAVAALEALGLERPGPGRARPRRRRRRALVRQPARRPDHRRPASSTPTTSCATTGWSSPTPPCPAARTTPARGRWWSTAGGRRRDQATTDGGRRARVDAARRADEVVELRTRPTLSTGTTPTDERRRGRPTPTTTGEPT